MNWQDLAMWAVVTAAAVHLLRRLLRLVSQRRQNSCGTACSGCPGDSSPPAKKPAP